MGGMFQPSHLFFIAIIALLVFGGRGRLSSIMGDAAKGIRAFQDGLKGDPDAHKDAGAPPSALSQAKTPEQDASKH